MALGSAVGFGLFYVFVDAGTASMAGTTGSRGSPLWVIAGARASSLLMLAAIALVGRRSALRWPGRRLGPVVLARWLLGERLSGGQNAGVVLALTGVGLLAAA